MVTASVCSIDLVLLPKDCFEWKNRHIILLIQGACSPRIKPVKLWVQQLGTTKSEDEYKIQNQVEASNSLAKGEGAIPIAPSMAFQE